MPFVEPKIEVFREILSKLNSTDTPLWGNMSSQRMIEHLSDAINLSIGTLSAGGLLIPEDKVEKAKRFIHSDYPMPRDFKAAFAKPDTPLREEDLKVSIEEFATTWEAFLQFYKNNPDHTQLHPYFGELNYTDWIAFHSKHFTHHFEQFNLV